MEREKDEQDASLAVIPSALLIVRLAEPAQAMASAGSWVRNLAQLSIRAPCAA